MPWTTPTDRTSGYTVTAADWNIVEDDLSFLYGDLAWTAVSTFTNTWSAGGVAPAYILLGRIVYLRGTLSAGTANTSAFTLPANYRPSAANNYWLTATSAAGTTANLVNVTSSGTVVPLNSSQTVLSSISFPVV